MEEKDNNNNNKLYPYIYKAFRKRQSSFSFHSDVFGSSFLSISLNSEPRGIINSSLPRNRLVSCSHVSRGGFAMRCGLLAKERKPSYLRARAPSSADRSPPPPILKDRGGGEPCRSPRSRSKPATRFDRGKWKCRVVTKNRETSCSIESK